MRALIALVAAGLVASPAVPKADDPAPARPHPTPAVLAASAPARAAPAPAARAPSPSVRAAPPPSARAAPSAQGAPAPRPSGAVRPAPPPRAGTVSPGVRPAPVPGTARYGPYTGYPHHHYPYYPYSYYPYSYYPYYPYWGFGVGVGFGLGWPYYPYYPYYSDYPDYPAYGYYGPYAPYAPPPPVASPPQPAAPPAPVTTVITFQGGAYSGAGAGAFAIGVDGRRFGFQGSIGGVGEDELRGVPVDEEPIVGWGIAHATWSLVATQRYRLRLEGGASMLFMPDSDAFAGQPYAGTVAVGPSLGVSGHARLVGPLGIEGHVRVTPVPVPVADSRAAAVLRVGPIGFAAGWRAIDVSGDREDGPQLRYSGPELGLSLQF